jgi:hypothetical protein
MSTGRANRDETAISGRVGFRPDVRVTPDHSMPVPGAAGYPPINSAEYHTARADDLTAGNVAGLTIREAAELIAWHRMAARAIEGESR